MKPLKRKKRFSPLQTAAITKIVERVKKGEKVSTSGIMVEVGYSPKTAHNPDKLTDSEAYQQALENAGLTKEFVADAVKDLVTASIKRVEEFAARIEEYTVKRLDGVKHLTRYINFTDQEIIDSVNTIPGAKVLKIYKERYRKIVHYLVPDRVSRKGGLEIVHKSRGFNAPEKHEHEVKHTATDEEKQLINEIFNST